MRILIGHSTPSPLDAAFARYEIRRVRTGRDGQRPPLTIAEMLEQCPPGWKPDVYYHATLGHFPVPADIEAFDGLTVTAAPDWDRWGRAIWAGAGFFDLILADRNGCAILKAGRYENAVFARFWSAEPELHRALPDVPKDIDILFVGSLSDAVWADRNRWLDRVARLSAKYRVVITEGVHGEDYVRLMNRAKIVFNRSIRGETNARAYEAPACGALVFNEDSNAETKEIFTDRVHCVYYDDTNFESRIDHYLAHDSEREALVAAGRALVLAEHTEEAHLAAIFILIEANRDKAGYRPAVKLARAERCLRLAQQIYSATQPAAVEVALSLLNVAEQDGFDRSRVREARAALQGWVSAFMDFSNRVGFLTGAILSARQAARAAPQNGIAQMTLGFLLLERAEATQGAPPSAPNDVTEAIVALAQAADLSEKALVEGTDGTADVEGFGYPRRGDACDHHIGRATLRRDLDEVAWAREMRAAIAWRCRALLSDLSLQSGLAAEAYPQAERAAQALPEAAESWARLARCATSLNRHEEAVAQYRHALALTPLAHELWPELARALVAAGRRSEAEDFVAERLQVISAIPSLAGVGETLRKAHTPQPPLPNLGEGECVG